MTGLPTWSRNAKWIYRVAQNKWDKQKWKFSDYQCNRQQPSPLLYSINIWPARNSRLRQRETNHYIARCASELAWPYLAGRSPGQLFIDLFCTASGIYCMLSVLWRSFWILELRPFWNSFYLTVIDKNWDETCHATSSSFHDSRVQIKDTTNE